MSPRGNRSAGYPIVFGLVPFKFHGSFAERFTYSALGLGYPIGMCLIPSRFRGSSVARLIALQIFYLFFIYVRMFDTNICACRYFHYLTSTLNHSAVLFTVFGLKSSGLLL